MKKCFASLALVIATLYLTLSVSAVACLFAHESRPGSAHHHTHTGGATQSSLCAWACHANPTVDLAATTPQLKPFQLVSMLLLVDSSVSSFLSQQSDQSRAPPRS